MPIYKVKSLRPLCLWSRLGVGREEAGIQDSLTPASVQSLFPKSLLLKVLPGSAASSSPGSLLKTSNPRVCPRSPGQYLPFSKIPSWLKCPFTFEKPCLTPRLGNPQIRPNPQVSSSITGRCVTVTPGRKPLLLAFALGPPAAPTTFTAPLVLCQVPGILGSLPFPVSNLVIPSGFEVLT